MGRILGRKIQEVFKLEFLYYFGNMSADDKVKSIEEFKNKPEVKVLVSVSLVAWIEGA